MYIENIDTWFEHMRYDVKKIIIIKKRQINELLIAVSVWGQKQEHRILSYLQLLSMVNSRFKISYLFPLK